MTSITFRIAFCRNITNSTYITFRTFTILPAIHHCIRLTFSTFNRTITGHAHIRALHNQRAVRSCKSIHALTHMSTKCKCSAYNTIYAICVCRAVSVITFRMAFPFTYFDITVITSIIIWTNTFKLKGQNRETVAREACIWVRTTGTILGAACYHTTVRSTIAFHALANIICIELGIIRTSNTICFSGTIASITFGITSNRFFN